MKSNQELSEQNVPMTEDELKAQMVENHEKELEMFKKQLESKEQGLERFSEQWERDEKIWQIKLKNYKKLTPTFEYETVEEYWDLIKSVIEDQYTQDKFMSERKMEHMALEIEQIKEQIKSNEEALNKLKGE